MKYELKQYPDGIYFDMPFDVYMAQDAHSNSRVSKINESVLNFWVDEIEPTLQPDFDLRAVLDDATESMAEGKAWHVMALEGAEAFDALYATDYDPAEYPDALKSKDDHLDACVKHGVIHKKGDTIAALQAALIEAGADVQFHSQLKDLHQAANASKELISATAMEELRRAGEIIQQYKVDTDLLSGGYPEVSIIVTIKGVRYKCRVDYLKPDMQVEYKTLTRRSRKKSFEDVCADQMHDFSYFSGAYIYTLCVEAARKELHKNLSFARGLPETQESVDWIDAFISGNQSASHDYWFLFQERGKYNHVLARRFDKYDEALQSRKIQAIWRTGQLAVERAVKLYDWYMENNGLQKRWLPAMNAKPWADDDFKPWQIEEI